MIQATRKQWIKFSVVLALYLAFLCWVKSAWGLLLVPFLFDIYITKKIPWSFWKTSQNSLVRSVMSWVDALLFSLVAVYFVNIYVFQNYQIPSSSLEKTLLVGDFLYVSKVSYGPRVPNTPLSLPLTQHTIPVLNVKSYLDRPQWKYKRVAGFGKVKRNDIVVFNFPAGDTVAMNYQQNDYYALAYEAGQELYAGRVDMDTLPRNMQRLVYNLYYQTGRKYLWDNPRQFGKIVYRPVDRRENYVKRCTGLPGDTLQIKDRTIYINGVAQAEPENVQFLYRVSGTGKPLPEDFLRDELGLSLEDLQGYQPGSTEFYLPLTKKARQQLLARKDLVAAAEPAAPMAGLLYPLNLHKDWTVENYGPIWIPAKGATVELTEETLPVYERCITAYEGNTLDVREDGIYINGVKTDRYTFRMDYYWMMGDNRDNSADSRSWGFVPEDHIVGKPILVWLSLDKDRGWFNGKIRWNRLFKWVH